MRVLLSWLAEFAPIGDPADRDHAEAIADHLAMLGLAAEGIEHLGSAPGVVTARVVRTEPHPGAEKIQRVWVDTGDGRERHVWCGAFNFGPDDIVPALEDR